MSSFSCNKSIRVTTAGPKRIGKNRSQRRRTETKGFVSTAVSTKRRKESASVLLTDCESRLSSSSLSGGTTGRGKGAEQRRSGGRGPFLKFIPWESVTTAAQANERKKERTNERADWRPSPSPFHSLSDVISRDKPQGAGSVRFLEGQRGALNFFCAAFACGKHSNQERLRIGLEEQKCIREEEREEREGEDGECIFWRTSAISDSTRLGLEV